MRRRVLLGCFILLVACEGERSPVSPPNGFVPGTLGLRDTALITVPAQAIVGDSVRVTITTTGSSCNEAGPTIVTGSGLSFEIRPYDDPGYGRPCLDYEKGLIHEAVVVFTRSGTGSITVVAQDSGGRALQVTRAIRILPRSAP